MGPWPPFGTTHNADGAVPLERLVEDVAPVAARARTAVQQHQWLSVTANLAVQLHAVELERPRRVHA